MALYFEQINKKRTPSDSLLSLTFVLMASSIFFLGGLVYFFFY